MSQLYYTPPSDSQFEELKAKAIVLWSTMGNEPSYAEEKIGRIRDIANVEDNFMYIVSMFDIYNQARLATELSAETRQSVRDRLLDGGTPSFLIAF